MALEQRLSVRMSQRLIMTPSLQQAIKLLQMSKLELVEEIQQELTENPVLEEALDDGPPPERPEPEPEPARSRRLPQPRMSPSRRLRIPSRTSTTSRTSRTSRGRISLAPRSRPGRRCPRSRTRWPKSKTSPAI